VSVSYSVADGSLQLTVLPYVAMVLLHVEG